MIHSLKMDDFGYMEIENVIELLTTYLKLKYQGDKETWLKSIKFDDTEPLVYMVTDKNEKLEELNGQLVKVHE